MSYESPTDKVTIITDPSPYGNSVVVPHPDDSSRGWVIWKTGDGRQHVADVFNHEEVTVTVADIQSGSGSVPHLVVPLRSVYENNDVRHWPMQTSNNTMMRYYVLACAWLKFQEYGTFFQGAAAAYAEIASHIMGADFGEAQEFILQDEERVPSPDEVRAYLRAGSR